MLGSRASSCSISPCISRMSTREEHVTLTSSDNSPWGGREHLVPAPADDSTTPESVPIQTALPVFSRRDLRCKRSLDLVVASVTLVLALPIMLIIAVLVKSSSRGPVLFRQERVGKGGRTFTMLKFRTMQNGTHEAVESDPELRELYIANDFKLPAGHAHITRIGKVLRKTSLDELPQLLNVLRGEMSVVGVRPIEPVQFDSRPDRAQVLYVLLPPGLTGLWQVEGRSNVKHADRIELDQQYMETWSPSDDLRLLFRTVPAVLRRHHAH